MRVIIDFDGTLTAEELQARPLAERSLDTLANEIVHAPRAQLAADYHATQARLLAEPHRYWWEVNGLIASYCDEGAFILNTTTLQVMLATDPAYARAAADYFPQAEYDPVVDCTNYLFHRHTAELPPAFRPGAREALGALVADPQCEPVVLTNSRGDKVARLLGGLGFVDGVAILGDTRQYEMDPAWEHPFEHPTLGPIERWPVDDQHTVDLRRPVYYRALLDAARDGAQLAVVADTFSLPGALPLLMGIPFLLLTTPYTPAWCRRTVGTHPLGCLLDDIAALPTALKQIARCPIPGKMDTLVL